MPVSILLGTEKIMGGVDGNTGKMCGNNVWYHKCKKGGGGQRSMVKDLYLSLH